LFQPTAEGLLATRHLAGMKPIFCLPLFLASFAWADEAADRADIARVIAMLNDSPPPIASVAESPEAAAEMAGRARTALFYTSLCCS
jgi:hypothetical protein